MNKLLLIVLLAVCLVSVQAFVKREATTEQSYIDKIQQDIAKLGETVKSHLNPDVIKKSFDDALENINKGIKQFTAKTEQKPAQ